ncbi:MAG: succinylglutamate desuccinylase/aspartoacylase family protein, partial [Shimia sp.]
MAKRGPFTLGEYSIAPGERRTVQLPLAVMSDHTPSTLSAHVVHGKRSGPVMFVSAGIHGDEIMGVEVIRRLLGHKALRNLRGTLIAVPIVNALGFLAQSRYLPDRRDLNRSFPGGPKGPLASRLAHLFLTEIVGRSDFGIDLHTAAVHRTNYPQVRISPGDTKMEEVAEVFGAPIVLTSDLREGSLRAAAHEMGRNVLLYEAGEALRFDEYSVRVGLTGVLRVMHHLGML